MPASYESIPTSAPTTNGVSVGKVNTKPDAKALAKAVQEEQDVEHHLYNPKLSVPRPFPKTYHKGRPLIPIYDIPEDSPYSPEEIDARKKLAAVFRLVDDHGWSQLIYNHITCKIPGTHEILINPFGLMYHEVTASSLVKISLDGKILDRGSTKYGFNRAGYVIHTALHEYRPDIFCTLHVHHAAVAGVSAMKCGLLPTNQEAMIIGPVSYLDYKVGIFESDKDKACLKDVVTQDLKKKVLILNNHGAVTLGETVEEAWYLMYNTVIACETQCKTMASGDHIMPPQECIDQAYDVIQHGANNMDTGNDWAPYQFGEFEWETWMRDLDARGFVTGHVYQEYPKRKSNESSH